MIFLLFNFVYPLTKLFPTQACHHIVNSFLEVESFSRFLFEVRIKLLYGVKEEKTPSFSVESAVTFPSNQWAWSNYLLFFANIENQLKSDIVNHC
jgi:hypothetical protein